MPAILEQIAINAANINNPTDPATEPEIPITDDPIE
jgi:hypothetical protein